MDKRQQKRHEKLLTNSQKLLDVTEPLSRKQLCEILGENYKARDFVEQERTWKIYFSFTKRKNKYYIQKVYDKEEVIQNRIQRLIENSIDYTACLLLDSYYSLTGKETLIVNDTQLGALLGLFNNNYYKFRPDPLDKDDFINKAIELENYILEENNKNNKNLPYIKREIRKNRKEQVQDITKYLLTLYKKYYEAEDNDDKAMMEYYKNHIEKHIPMDLIKNYLNNQGKDFLPSEEVYDGLLQFYNHVPRNMKTKIDGLLKDLSDDYIIHFSKPYAGIKDKQVTILSDAELSKFLKIVQESTEDYLFGGNSDPKMVGFLMRFKPDDFREFYQKRIQEELGYDNVIIVNKIVFNKDVIRKNKEWYAQKFEESLCNTSILNLVLNNCADFKTKETKNFQKRKESLKKKHDATKISGDKTFNYLNDKLLKVDLADYRNSDDNYDLAYVPSTWYNASKKSKDILALSEYKKENTKEEKELSQEELQRLAYLVNSTLGNHLPKSTIDKLLDAGFEF